jgi:hypothetical protein
VIAAVFDVGQLATNSRGYAQKPVDNCGQVLVVISFPTVPPIYPQQKGCELVGI